MTIPKGYISNHKLWPNGRTRNVHSWEWLPGAQLCFPWGKVGYTPYIKENKMNNKHWSGCICPDCAMEAGMHPSQEHKNPFKSKGENKMIEDKRKRCGVSFRMKPWGTTEDIMTLDVLEMHINAAKNAMNKHLARKYSVVSLDKDIEVYIKDNCIRLVWYQDPDTYMDNIVDLIAEDIKQPNPELNKELKEAGYADDTKKT